MWRWKFLLDPEESGSEGGGDDASDAGGVGGKGGGDTKEHPWDAIKPFLNEDGNLVVKNAGREVTLGPAAVVAEIQKSQTASKRLEEATAAQNEAAGEIQYAQDVAAALEDDEDAYFRLAEFQGFTRQEAQAVLDEEDQVGEVDELEVTPQVQYVERAQSQAEKDNAQWAHRERMKQVKAGIFADIDVGLDKDPRFATIMKGGGKRAGQVQSLAQRAVTRIVVSTGSEFDEGVLSAALDEVASDVEAFGGGNPPPPGAGAAYSGAPVLMPLPETRMKRPDPSDVQAYDRYCEEQITVLAHKSQAKD